MDSNNVGISIIFFIFLIIFGSFFTMQLVLAEIIESFQANKKLREEAERQAETDAYLKKIREEKAIRDKEEAEKVQKPGGEEEIAQKVEDDFLAQKDPEVEIFDDSAWEDERVCDRDARRRSHENGLYRMFYVFVMNPFFNLFIFLMIMANTVSLAADDYPMTDQKEHVIDICNQYFTWLFTAEMVAKMIGLGYRNYMKDAYNKFDCFIVCISLIDWTI